VVFLSASTAFVKTVIAAWLISQRGGLSVDGATGRREQTTAVQLESVTHVDLLSAKPVLVWHYRVSNCLANLLVCKPLSLLLAIRRPAESGFKLFAVSQGGGDLNRDFHFVARIRAGSLLVGAASVSDQEVGRTWNACAVRRRKTQDVTKCHKGAVAYDEVSHRQIYVIRTRDFQCLPGTIRVE
jgi:hypothetical protein